MENQLDLSKSSIFRVLKKKLHYSELYAPFMLTLWIPYTLSEMNKELRLLCNNLLNIMDIMTIIHAACIVNGDKTWLYAFEPEPKMQVRECRPKSSIHC